MAIRDSFPITLLPPTQISASGSSTPVTGLKGTVDLTSSFACSQVPTGGSPVLDVYLQTSVDGVTWQDIAHVRFNTTTATSYVNICGEQPASQSIVIQADGALGVNQVVQGPWADKLRLKWTFTAGGSTGSYILNVNGYVK